MSVTSGTPHQNHTEIARHVLGDIASGRISPSNVSVAEANAIIRVANCRSNRHLSKIGQLIRDGRCNLAMREQRRYLHSRSAKLVAATKKVHTSRERIGQRFGEVYPVVDSLGFGHQPDHVIRYTKQKASSGYRTLYRYSVSDQAQQALLSNAHSPFLSSLPNHVRWRGRGPTVESLRTMVETASEDDVFIQIDVRGFFSAISHQWVEEHTPLPTSLLRSVHTGPFNTTCRSNRCQARHSNGADSERTSRHGLPEGSALSPKIAEWVMADVLLGGAPLLANLPYVIQSDNLGVVCPAAQAERLVQSLRMHFLTHPAGPFEIRSTIRPITEPFRYMGYSWQRRPNGSCRIFVPTQIWQDRFNYHITRVFAGDPGQVDRHVQKMQGWCGAFSSWPGHRHVRRHFVRMADAIIAERELGIHPPMHCP